MSCPMFNLTSCGLNLISHKIIFHVSRKKIPKNINVKHALYMYQKTNSHESPAIASIFYKINQQINTTT